MLLNRRGRIWRGEGRRKRVLAWSAFSDGDQARERKVAFLRMYDCKGEIVQIHIS